MITDEQRETFITNLATPAGRTKLFESLVSSFQRRLKVRDRKALWVTVCTNIRRANLPQEEERRLKRLAEDAFNVTAEETVLN